MIRQTSKLFLVIVFLLLMNNRLLSQSSRVNWFAFDMGFGEPTFANNKITSAVGQSFVGLSLQANAQITSGFLGGISKLVTGVIQDELVPRSFSLHQNFPNPFNPSTVIRYELPVNSRVMLRIFNILGQEVKTLVNEVQDPGFKQVEWNASGVASGMYFYRFEATGTSDPAKTFVESRKVVLLR